MNRADLVVVGSGSLAGRVVQGLAVIPKTGMRVAIVARSRRKAAQLALIANARASMVSSSARFEAVEIAKFETVRFSKIFGALRPKAIFQTASLQSPWESAEGQNGWTRLVAAAGFGITLPLQMALTAEVSRAASDGRAAVVNACYPDCVNVALERVGLGLTCGIGNAGIVEAFCRAHERAQGAEVHVVGHHGHLAGWLKGNASAAQPRIWVKGKEVEALALSPKVEAMGEDLNDVTAATALAVILALVNGKTLRVSLPGVAGFAGGYPFAVNKGKFKLDLPSGLSVENAIAQNRSGERIDGLELREGVTFTEKAQEALAAVGFAYAQGFAFKEWEKARNTMIGLSERLRAMEHQGSTIQ